MSMVPVRARVELEDASARRIGYQLRWELRRLIDEQDMTQEHLAMEVLGYATPTAASKWFNGRAPLPVKVAQLLDENFGPTHLGVSWRELLRRQRAANARDGRDAAGKADIYDVFLASPMAAAAASGTYEAERRTALDVVDTLQGYLGMKVFYAGKDLETADSFDVPDLAAEMNFDALRESRYFLLVYTEPQSDPTPSSVWTEAGYALALRKPSLYLVHSANLLPYCLRSLQQVSSTAKLPPVLFQPADTMQRAGTILKRHGNDLFARLDASGESGR